ncbi:MAG: respiratory nitrate reductase subunit gamma [Deltaproteobacteria bacterium]|nr:respiratory nitrate reductase subunit gamma [Deltaproteobacteria bacterium]
MLDLLLFGVFPYVAIILLLVVSIQRYRSQRFTFSSLSSQFLESRRLFWGSVPFHLGILGVLFGHLIGFAIPRGVQLWNGDPLRLWILEVTALVFGSMALLGLIALVVRRMADRRLHQPTSIADKTLHVILFGLIGSGIYIALFHRWGSSWYAQVAVPYLRSIFLFQPNITILAPLPFAVKLHITLAWSLVAIFSFTRMVHVLVAPIPYLWRPNQLVIWNRRRGDQGETPTAPTEPHRPNAAHDAHRTGEAVRVREA